MDLVQIFTEVRGALSPADREIHSDARLREPDGAKAFLDLPAAEPLQKALDSLTGHQLEAFLNRLCVSEHKEGPLPIVIAQYFATRVRALEPHKLREYMGPADLDDIALPAELAPVARVARSKEKKPKRTAAAAAAAASPDDAE